VNLAFPILYVLATIVICGLPMIITPVETAIGLAMILSGVPVYFIFVFWKNKPEMIRRWSSNFTVFMQKLLVVLAPTKKQD